MPERRSTGPRTALIGLTLLAASLAGCRPAAEILAESSWPASWESLNLYAGDEPTNRALASGDVNAGRAIALAIDAQRKADRAVQRADEPKPREDVEPIEGGVRLVVVVGADDPTPAPLKEVIDREVVTIKKKIAEELDEDSLDRVQATSGGGSEEPTIYVDGEKYKLSEYIEAVDTQRREDAARRRFGKSYSELTAEEAAEIESALQAAKAEWAAKFEAAQAESAEERRRLRDALLEIMTPELLERLMPLALTREQAPELFPESVAKDVRWVMIRPSPERAWSGLEPASHKVIDQYITNPLLRPLAHAFVPVARGFVLDKYDEVIADAATVLELRARGIDHNSVGIEDPFEDWVEAAGKEDGGKVFSDESSDPAGAASDPSGDQAGRGSSSSSQEPR
ncbi:MAG: hypothetical protein AAGI17_04245 [Planctomycetota bacterium]